MRSVLLFERFCAINWLEFVPAAFERCTTKLLFMSVSAWRMEPSLRRGLSSRSSVVHRAVELLRLAELEDAYAEAWDEWGKSAEAEAWDMTAGDGIADAAR